MKKGFSLIELLVSLVIISITMVFMTVLLTNLRSEKADYYYNANDSVNTASITKILNEDAMKYGIKSIELPTASNYGNFLITYGNGSIGKIQTVSRNSFRYILDEKIVFSKSYSKIGNISFSYNKNSEEYYKEYDTNADGNPDYCFIKYIIGIPSSANIVVYYYGEIK